MQFDIRHSTLSKMKLAEIVEAVLSPELLGDSTSLLEQLTSLEEQVSGVRIALNSSKTIADQHRAALLSQVGVSHPRPGGLGLVAVLAKKTSRVVALGSFHFARPIARAAQDHVFIHARSRRAAARAPAGAQEGRRRDAGRCAGCRVAREGRACRYAAACAFFVAAMLRMCRGVDSSQKPCNHLRLAGPYSPDLGIFFRDSRRV